MPEVMISSLLATMMFGLVAMLTIHIAYGMRSSENYYNFEKEGQFALDVFSRDVRQAFRVASNSTAMVALAGTNASVITYSYNPDTR